VADEEEMEAIRELDTNMQMVAASEFCAAAHNHLKETTRYQSYLATMRREEARGEVYPGRTSLLTKLRVGRNLQDLLKDKTYYYSSGGSGLDGDVLPHDRYVDYLTHDMNRDWLEQHPEYTWKEWKFRRGSGGSSYSSRVRRRGLDTGIENETKEEGEEEDEGVVVE